MCVRECECRKFGVVGGLVFNSLEVESVQSS